jgi:puromycin-sensitive aminopeptidase
VSERFLSLDKAAMIEKFFRENPLPGSERSVAQAIETIRVNSAWLARDGAHLHKYLAK